MHLEAEQIQRLLHGELGGLEEAVSSHLADCAECRRTVEEARRAEARVFDLLGRLDHSVPAVRTADVVARGRKVAVWGRRAAGIVLLLGTAGVAYAAPGSPLPAWLDRVVERIMGSPAQVPTAPQPAPAAPTIAGIAVTPGDRFTIAFAAPQARGVATVWVAEGSDVVVRARNGNATFTSGAAGLTVNNQESLADYEIELPRAAPHIEIRAGSRRLLVKDDGRIVAGAPADSLGRYRLDLVPPVR
jgi:hypothetical protein